MKKFKFKLLMIIGVLLIVAGGFGWGYTYMLDHRSAASLSAYCNIDFQTDVDEEGRISTATLTMVDYRYNGAELKKNIELICDGETFIIEGVTKQSPPTYSFIFYNERTSFKNTNKFFAEFPIETFKAIKNSSEVRVRMVYDNGDVIDLPLDDHDLGYWKEHLPDQAQPEKAHSKQQERSTSSNNSKNKK